MGVSKLKPMQAIHSAFCMAIFTFGVLSYYMRTGPVYFNLAPDRGSGFFPLFPLLGLAAIAGALFLFRRQIAAAFVLESLDGKIARYQTAFIIRSAFLEGAALMNIVAFLKDSNLVFLAVALLAFLILVIMRPGKQRVIKELRLEYPDTEKL